ncbi:MAG: glycosyltransferase family 4 protein [Candidatus Aminicenantes bacterium]|nr:glycosyltransferase family 4 protein [Candidatus Aminicenantes bacterium]
MNAAATPRSLQLIQGLRSGSGPAAAEFFREVERLRAADGIQAAFNYILRTEAALGLRKPTLAIYDQAFHLIGGAQKYGLTMASALRDLFEITIIANKDIRLEDFRRWYNLNLSGCATKVVRIPYYEDKGLSFLDPALVKATDENPFHRMSCESGGYDVFVNNSMNEMVYPLSNISVLVCHFPERPPTTYFYADRYTYVVYNSRYTAGWVEKLWRFTPHRHIYPPVDLEGTASAGAKKKLILSVARFEPEGTKRQREMIEAFLKLDRLHPDIVKDWKFVLVGGSEPKNRYLDKLEGLVRGAPRRNVELRVNIPAAELRALYGDASLFWHMCGVFHDHPSEVEHFGMTTVEAMENRAVPVVYAGGGLKEIVEHGVDGFLVRTTGELLDYSLRLIRDPALVEKLGNAAHVKAQNFSRAKFEERVRAFFGGLLQDYNLR